MISDMLTVGRMSPQYMCSFSKGGQCNLVKLGAKNSNSSSSSSSSSNMGVSGLKKGEEREKENDTSTCGR